MTRYVFLLDVDIIPSPGIVGPLAKFVSGQTCQKCAFVIPTYELDDKWPQVPEDKTALLKLVQIGKAQPYHQKVFIHNQYATNISEFEREQDDSNLHTSHKVTNYEFFYSLFPFI